jgi:hypothetical protein
MRTLMALTLALALASCDGGDTNTDAGTEGPACIATTLEGSCNARLMCGCEPDWCRWMLDVTECAFYEGCTAGVVGTLAVGDECDESMIIPDPPWCAPGTICLRYAGDSGGQCRQLCESDDECLAVGGTCGTPNVSFDPTDPHSCLPATMEIPFGVCL